MPSRSVQRADGLPRGVAQFGSFGLQSLKGFPELVPAWRVVGLAAVGDRLDRSVAGLAPLIGRQRELQTLVAAFDRMRVGTPIATHVVGEAGIGKSRLVRELALRYGEHFTLLVAQCSAHGRSTAFHPFIDLLHHWRDESRHEGGTLVDRLVGILTTNGGEIDDTLLLAQAVVNHTQVLCWDCDFPSTIGLAQSHLPHIQTLGDMEEVSRSRTRIGEGYLHAGHYHASREALAIGRTLSDDQCVGYATGELLWLDSIDAEGDVYNSLPQRAGEIEALGQSIGDRYLTTLGHYARWAYAAQGGRVGDAIGQADRLCAMGKRENTLLWHSV